MYGDGRLCFVLINKCFVKYKLGDMGRLNY